MIEALIFGSPAPKAHNTERRAAYLVVIRDGLVAMVKSGKSYFLPGGGAEAGEAAEETVVREVREELAQDVRSLRPLGSAIQYFYSSADDRHYEMLATFFAGEFTNELFDSPREHEMVWLPLAEVERACFHECHAWAVRYSVTQP